MSRNRGAGPLDAATCENRRQIGRLTADWRDGPQYIDTMARRRPHSAWIVLAVTFFALLAGAGIRATPSVLIVPLEQEFGWTRSTISLAISVNIFLYGLMGPFAGGLMQRLGIRRTTLGALTLLATGVALATQVTRPWQLVLVWGSWSAPAAGWRPWCSAPRSSTAGSTLAAAWRWASSRPAPRPASSSSCRSSPRSSATMAGGPRRSSWPARRRVAIPDRRAVPARASRRPRHSAVRRRAGRARGRRRRQPGACRPRRAG